jgi:uncharacterized membrane protein YkgB
MAGLKVVDVPFRWLRTRQLLLFRIALAAIFLWFGALKLTGRSAVDFIIQESYPILAQYPYFQILGIFEVAIGVGLLSGRYAPWIALLLVTHLSGTLAIFFINPALVFDPYFPFLTLAGEFILKNVALIAGGLAILARLPVVARGARRRWPGAALRSWRGRPSRSR